MWTYWDNEDKIPKVVRMCMESWKKWNPDYEKIKPIVEHSERAKIAIKIFKNI
jgi:mannosyltransferase OCH1-like enzyme